jgi:hypothetical protein
MDDATGAAEALLGLPGCRVLAVEETAVEVVIEIETAAELVGCLGCGGVAAARTGSALSTGIWRRSAARLG